MRRKRQHIYILRLHVNGDVPDRLNRVGVEHDARLAANSANFGYRQNGADLVIGKHHGNERGVGADCLRDLFCRDKSVVVDGQICYLIALFFKLF